MLETWVRASFVSQPQGVAQRPLPCEALHPDGDESRSIRIRTVPKEPQLNIAFGQAKAPKDSE